MEEEKRERKSFIIIFFSKIGASGRRMMNLQQRDRTRALERHHHSQLSQKTPLSARREIAHRTRGTGSNDTMAS